MRLIDADALKEKAFLTYQNNGAEIEEIMVVPIGAIDNTPTIEHKFCKTCNYWNGDLKYCMKWSAFMDKDDFCSEHWKEGDEK